MIFNAVGSGSGPYLWTKEAREQSLTHSVTATKTGKTIYANKIVIYNKFGGLFVQRMVWGAVGGWILIPVAVIKSIAER